MNTANATPPPDFPRQVIVMDRELAQRHPDKGFYLRIGQVNGDVGLVYLESEVTLAGAFQAARKKGYEPTYWMETTSGQANRIPSSIQQA